MEPLLKEELERLRAENAQLKAMVVPPALSQAPAAPAPTLVERFDIEPYSDFPAKWSNFIVLVLLRVLYRRQILQQNIRWN